MPAGRSILCGDAHRSEPEVCNTRASRLLPAINDADDGGAMGVDASCCSDDVLPSSGIDDDSGRVVGADATTLSDIRSGPPHDDDISHIF